MSFGDTRRLFQIFPFYNAFIEKPEIKRLSNIELLHELPFYEGYARRYKPEIVDSKDPLVQLEASKSSIKDLFRDLLNEMKGFKYQKTVAILLSKHKMDGYTEYSPVYFTSTTKTVINSEYMLDKSFQETLYRIDSWINSGSSWIIESMEGEYVLIIH